MGDDIVETVVDLTVTETVTYHFTATVNIPTAVAEKPKKLAAHMAEEEHQWLDALPIDGGQGTVSVTERSVDKARVRPRTSRT
jgi:hypothetical protein